MNTGRRLFGSLEKSHHRDILYNGGTAKETACFVHIAARRPASQAFFVWRGIPRRSNSKRGGSGAQSVQDPQLQLVDLPFGSKRVTIVHTWQKHRTRYSCEARLRTTC